MPLFTSPHPFAARHQRTCCGSVFPSSIPSIVRTEDREETGADTLHNRSRPIHCGHCVVQANLKQGPARRRAMVVKEPFCPVDSISLLQTSPVPSSPPALPRPSRYAGIACELHPDSTTYAESSATAARERAHTEPPRLPLRGLATAHNTSSPGGRAPPDFATSASGIPSAAHGPRRGTQLLLSPSSAMRTARTTQPCAVASGDSRDHVTDTRPFGTSSRTLAFSSAQIIHDNEDAFYPPPARVMPSRSISCAFISRVRALTPPAYLAAPFSPVNCTRRFRSKQTSNTQ